MPVFRTDIVATVPVFAGLSRFHLQGILEFSSQFFSRIYYTGDILDEAEMGWACSLYAERRHTYSVLVEQPEGKKPVGRQTLR